MTNKTNSKITNLYHIDLYRLEKSEDVESLGLNELLQNKDSVVVIEWAEKLGSLLSPNWIIKFEYLNENERKIIINKYG